jgi:hypothetical protein
VQQLRSFSDDRLVNGCIYCGGPEETRDHVPSRVFLDSPYPENLPIVAACTSCNNGFSQDEEYFACLIESVLADSTDPDKIRRTKIADIFRRKPALRAKIEAAKNTRGDQIQFDIETNRIKNVIFKLARGHAAFELSQVCHDEPSTFWFYPLALLHKEQQDLFDASHVVELLGEVGSRNTQRLLATQVFLESVDDQQKKELNLIIDDWLDVQEGRYRYLAIDDSDEVKIKIVIAEYLACEITWVK